MKSDTDQGKVKTGRQNKSAHKATEEVELLRVTDLKM